MIIGRIAVFASGGGSTFRYICERLFDGELCNMEIVVLIADKPDIGAITHAEELGIPVRIINPKDFASEVEFGEAILSRMRGFDVDTILMAGYLKKMPEIVIERFQGRVINQHPGDITKYGGDKKYGIAVHEAVLAAGEKRTCVTIHFADKEYDHGPIITQMWIDIPAGISARELQQLLLPIEHVAYISTLKALQALPEYQ